MTETILLLLYGAIVVASAFLIGSMTKLAIKEFYSAGPINAAGSTYFWLAAGHAASAIALTLICGARTIAGLNGEVSGGTGGFVGWALVIGLALLLITKIGFNWASTREAKHGRLLWASFMVSLVCWVAFVFGRQFVG